VRYRKLGATSLTVSEVGFGAWGIGGSVNGDVAYGPTDSAESIKALRTAAELGVTFFDTSDFYGYGHSEELIGQALGDLREDVVIATKVGMLDAEGGQDFSRDHIIRSLDASLQRLQTDYVDLYLLHSPDIEELSRWPELLSSLESLQEQGKIREYGISTRSPEDGLAAVRDHGIGVLQVNFSMIDQRAIDCGLFDLCLEKNIGIIGRTPLCFGFLTGEYSDSKKFHSLDHRSKWSPEQIKRWAEAYQLFTENLTGADRYSNAQIAIRYCLSYPVISTVIPGMLVEGHVRDNVAASDQGTLEEKERANIEDIYRRHTFFAGK
jgi:aryl-alcohol dehydrogenase-like predicted oxidoreductase